MAGRTAILPNQIPAQAEWRHWTFSSYGTAAMPQYIPLFVAQVDTVIEMVRARWEADAATSDLTMVVVRAMDTAQVGSANTPITVAVGVDAGAESDTALPLLLSRGVPTENVIPGPTTDSHGTVTPGSLVYLKFSAEVDATFGPLTISMLVTTGRLG